MHSFCENTKPNYKTKVRKTCTLKTSQLYFEICLRVADQAILPCTVRKNKVKPIFEIFPTVMAYHFIKMYAMFPAMACAPHATKMYKNIHCTVSCVLIFSHMLNNCKKLLLLIANWQIANLQINMNCNIFKFKISFQMAIIAKL
jgi:hypothetical protein